MDEFPQSKKLSSSELQRYARQMSLPNIGAAGQEKLSKASVLCIGAGGLGCPALSALAAAGVGIIGIVDEDRVELSNLHRQLLYSEEDIGELKAEVAARRLSQINSHVEVKIYPERFVAANALEIAEGYDVILDGSDNFPTRYLSSDVAVWLGIPNVYGSVYRYEGQCSLFDSAGGGPCYRCLFPEPPKAVEVPDCATGGVLSVLPSIIGGMQALEAIKYIVSKGESRDASLTNLTGRLLHYDGLSQSARSLQVKVDPHCAVCSPAATIFEPVDYEAFCGGGGSGESSEVAAVPQVTVADLEQKLKKQKSEQPVLLDVREDFERAVCSIDESYHIPLGELEKSWKDLVAEIEQREGGELWVICKSGVRSQVAAEFLLEQGLAHVANVAGGMDAWLGKD